MPAQSTQIERINLRLPVTLVVDLTNLAESTGMSRADYILMVLNGHVRTHVAKSLLSLVALEDQQEVGNVPTQFSP
jgi:hypothetical protein